MISQAPRTPSERVDNARVTLPWGGVMLMEFSGPVARQVAAAFEHQVAERLVASGHPAYGLGDTWTGPRMLGDVHFVGENVDSVGLAHGDAAAEHGPLFHVHTTRVRSDDLDRVFAARSELAPGVYDGQPVPPFVKQDVRLRVEADSSSSTDCSRESRGGWADA
jgi:hypothetical protein